MNKIIALLLMCSFTIGCSYKKNISEQELKEYIADEVNGLYKKTVKNDITIETYYRPSELVWARDLADVKDTHERTKQKQMVDSLSYFMLHFSRKGKEIENGYVSDPAKFKDVVNYLSFSIGNDIFLLHNNKDTLHAIDAVYSRTFGIADGTTVMAVFSENLNEEAGSVKLCFDDTMLDTGFSEFEFKISDIKNIPTLTSK